MAHQVMDLKSAPWNGICACTQQLKRLSYVRLAPGVVGTEWHVGRQAVSAPKAIAVGSGPSVVRWISWRREETSSLSSLLVRRSMIPGPHAMPTFLYATGGKQ